MSNQKITALTSFGALNTGDYLLGVDVSDPTMSPQGSNKKLTMGDLAQLYYPAGNPNGYVQGSGLNGAYVSLTGNQVVSGQKTLINPRLQGLVIADFLSGSSGYQGGISVNDFLMYAYGSLAIDWGARQLWDESQNQITVYWGNGQYFLADAQGNPSVYWNDRYTVDPNGKATVDFGGRGLYDPIENLIVDWSSQDYYVLRNANTSVALQWGSIDGGGVQVPTLIVDNYIQSSVIEAAYIYSNSFTNGTGYINLLNGNLALGNGTDVRLDWKNRYLYGTWGADLVTGRFLGNGVGLSGVVNTSGNQIVNGRKTFASQVGVSGNFYVDNIYSASQFQAGHPQRSVLDVLNGTYSNGDGNQTLDMGNSLLRNPNDGNYAVDWGNRVMNDTNGNPAFDWSQRFMFDQNGNPVLILDSSIINGTPYLYQDWGCDNLTVNGTLTLNSDFNAGQVACDHLFAGHIYGDGYVTTIYPTSGLFQTGDFFTRDTTLDWRKKQLLRGWSAPDGLSGVFQGDGSALKGINKIFSNSIAYVQLGGNDTTAVVDNPNLPFATYTGAYEALSGQSVRHIQASHIPSSSGMPLTISGSVVVKFLGFDSWISALHMINGGQFHGNDCRFVGVSDLQAYPTSAETSYIDGARIVSANQNLTYGIGQAAGSFVFTRCDFSTDMTPISAQGGLGTPGTNGNGHDATPNIINLDFSSYDGNAGSLSYLDGSAETILDVSWGSGNTPNQIPSLTFATNNGFSQGNVGQVVHLTWTDNGNGLGGSGGDTGSVGFSTTYATSVTPGNGTDGGTGGNGGNITRNWCFTAGSSPHVNGGGGGTQGLGNYGGTDGNPGGSGGDGTLTDNYCV